MYAWCLGICAGLQYLKSLSSKVLHTWKTSQHNVITRPNLLACTGTQARRLSNTRIITLTDVVYFDFLSHHLFCCDQTVIYISAPVIVDHKPRVRFLVMLTQSSLSLLELFFSFSSPSEPNHIPRSPPFFLNARHMFPSEWCTCVYCEDDKPELDCSVWVFLFFELLWGLYNSYRALCLSSSFI